MSNISISFEMSLKAMGIALAPSVYLKPWVWVYGTDVGTEKDNDRQLFPCLYDFVTCEAQGYS